MALIRIPEDSADQVRRRRLRPGLAERVLIGLVVGIAAGAFFGELAHSLKIVGDAFIMLLQVAVIPYIVASLITALGRLTLDDAKKLGLKAGGVLLVLWAVGATVLLLTPLAFPDGPSASFFSMSQVEEVKPVDFLKLYIPANPFASLANTVIPAIVVFNVLIGVALIGVKNKQSVLEPLSAIAEALMAVTGLVARLAPYGAFALAASAAPWFASVFPGTRRRSHSRGPCCSMAVLVPLSGLGAQREVFESESTAVDAIGGLSEEGAAWTLLYHGSAIR